MSKMYEKIEKIEGAMIAPSADVYGKVKIGKDSCVWFNTVIRADSNTVTIGERSNVQDLAMVHTELPFEVKIGNDVTIGHSAIIHGCTIGDNTLIGMGAIIMNGAKIGKNCIIGAGALVTQNTVIEDGSMALGSPAKVKRKLTEEEIAGIKRSADHYVQYAKDYFGEE